MRYQTDDLRIRAMKQLIAPEDLIRLYPLTDAISATVYHSRRAIRDILHDDDDRLLAVVGPCSVHDVSAAREYAERLRLVRDRLEKELLIVMRVYFEKPRTTVGWKGLINDPYLDGSFEINEGLKLARSLLVDINGMGVPAGTEFLDLISPQYIADLISWGAIGARTTESQGHRELSSGLSCPVGFKNATSGSLRIAPSPPFSVGDQGGALGHLRHRRQPGYPRHPARRHPPQLRHRERQHGGGGDGGCRPAPAHDDRLQPCQQPQEAAEAGGRGP